MDTPAQRHQRFLAPGDKLGKYVVIRPIAVGDMAELYLMRTVGIEGFEKLVCVKRLLPQYIQSASVVAMFLNEARLAATLHHANIAQVYDIGLELGEYFFAMEYVHGEDLGRMVVAGRENGVPISLDCSLTLAAGLCAGLHHAHDKAGSDGKPLGVVHRDVSPSNVLVSYDGAVKLVDFGIADAAGEASASRSQSGLGGKIEYMSPEQCRGNVALDRRSDVFSIGTILYELTTGQLPFLDDTEYGVLHQIVNRDAAPPTTLVPSYPAALEAIVMRALARDPERRYATALELQHALEDYAHANRLRISALVLARLMSTLFPARLEDWDDARAQGAFFVEQHVVRTLIESGKTADDAPRYTPPLEASRDAAMPARVASSPRLEPPAAAPPGAEPRRGSAPTLPPSASIAASTIGYAQPRVTPQSMSAQPRMTPRSLTAPRPAASQSTNAQARMTPQSLTAPASVAPPPTVQGHMTPQGANRRDPMSPQGATPQAYLAPQSATVQRQAPPSSADTQGHTTPDSMTAVLRMTPHSMTAQPRMTPQSMTAQPRMTPQSTSAQPRMTPQSTSAQPRMTPQSTTAQPRMTPQSTTAQSTTSPGAVSPTTGVARPGAPRAGSPSAQGERTPGRQAPVPNMPGAVPILRSAPARAVPTAGTLVSATSAGASEPARSRARGPEPSRRRADDSGASAFGHAAHHTVADLTERVRNASARPTQDVPAQKPPGRPILTLALFGVAGTAAGVWFALRTANTDPAAPAERAVVNASAKPLSGTEASPSATNETSPTSAPPATTNTAPPTTPAAPTTVTSAASPTTNDALPATSAAPTPAAPTATAVHAAPPATNAAPTANSPPPSAEAPAAVDRELAEPAKQKLAKGGAPATPSKAAKPARGRVEPKRLVRPAKAAPKEQPWNDDSPFLPEPTPKR